MIHSLSIMILTIPSHMQDFACSAAKLKRHNNVTSKLHRVLQQAFSAYQLDKSLMWTLTSSHHQSVSLQTCSITDIQTQKHTKHRHTSFTDGNRPHIQPWGSLRSLTSAQSMQHVACLLLLYPNRFASLAHAVYNAASLHQSLPDYSISTSLRYTSITDTNSRYIS